MPLTMNLNLLDKPPVDKIRKYGAKEFRATSDDNAEKAEFWLENTIRVFEEISLTPDKSMKYVVSLLRDAAYQWWKTLISQKIHQSETKGISGTETGLNVCYEIRMRYARECVSTEAIMCKRFEDDLNEDIRLLVGVLEIKEFVVLVDRACKAEALGKDKKKAKSEARDVRKRFQSRSFQPVAKKFQDEHSRSKTNMSSKIPATSIVSVGNVRSERPECKYCGKRHPRSCRLND
ncbi:Gag-Pol polyprotein [Gossypium australe]|uniref:Gag-Pol polyprotein n=1 Tax=Gossypium australe TaxID=47621 RepID=A0A5B6WQX2_9ROSI|nr:Gag-Pol polyprotein [Gossypium australe]